MKTRAAAACVALVFAASAYAQDMPVPKMFRGMQGQKGQYKVEILEGGGRATKDGMRGQTPTMTVCTDNVLKNSSGGDRPRPDSGCKHRLLKDTADEAVMESVCKERTSTVSMKREGKSMLMTISSAGPGGPQSMKMRYTHLGACREGQGAVSFDKDSEQCRQMKAQAAKMDPAKMCARAKSDREACEQRMRDMAAQMSAMCG